MFWVIIWLSTSADWQAECFTTTLPTSSNPLHFSRLPVLALWVSGWLKPNSIHLHPVALLLHRNSIVVPICAHDGYTKNLVIRIARFNTLDTLRIEQPPEKRETDFLCNWRCQVLTPCGHCRIVILSIVVPLSFSFSGDPQTSFSKKNRHRPVEWDWLDKLQRLPRRSRLNQTPWPLPLNSSQEKESVEISILH